MKRSTDIDYSGIGGGIAKQIDEELAMGDINSLKDCRRDEKCPNCGSTEHTTTRYMPRYGADCPGRHCWGCFHNWLTAEYKERVKGT